MDNKLPCNYQRCTACVAKLAALVTREPLTSDDLDAALGIVMDTRITHEDFTALDTAPARWSYRVQGFEWHFKLRQLRNRRTQDLFAQLRANETLLGVDQQERSV